MVHRWLELLLEESPMVLHIGRACVLERSSLAVVIG
jgi:hypothetical protein